jgi:SH3-like domain-containing protein
MDPKGLRILLAVVFLAVGGCAGAGSTAAPSRPEIQTYYYVGVLELTLRATPDPAGAPGARVRLNERVQSLQRRGSWFLVRTAGGQEGWASDRDLNLEPVSQLYVRRWDVRLRQAPDDGAATRERLRANDQVKALEQNSQGWVRATVARTGSTGWLRAQDLSLERVATPRPVKRRSPPPPAPAALPGVTPSPAEAAPPPPAAVAPSPAPPAPHHGPGKAKPEMFEPF